MHQSGEEAMFYQDRQRCHNCRLAKDRTGDEYDLTCRLFSAVALLKIEKMKNMFSNVFFSLLSHCQRLKCSFYFIVTLPKDQNRQKILLKMSSFLYCSVGGR
jgi:hypothetical protein